MSIQMSSTLISRSPAWLTLTRMLRRLKLHTTRARVRPDKLRHKPDVAHLATFIEESHPQNRGRAMRLSVNPLVILIVLNAIGICGCTTKGGDPLDVKRLSGNTYEITTHVVGLSSDLQSVMNTNNTVATKYCTEQGKNMSIVSRQAYGGFARQDVLTFRCGKAVGNP